MNVIKDRIVRGNIDNYDDIIYIENSLLPNEIYKQIERKNLNKKEYNEECEKLINRIKELKKVNPLIAKSIRLEFIEDKYYNQIPQKLYQLLTCFPRYQLELINMPENRFKVFAKTIDTMLEEGFSTLDIATNFNLICNKITECIPVIDKEYGISDEEYIKKFDASSIDYNALIYKIFTQHSFKVEVSENIIDQDTFQDAILGEKSIFQVLKEETTPMIESEDILQKINAVILLKYGLTLNDVQNIFFNAEKIIKDKNSDLYLMYRDILELTDMSNEELKKEYDSISEIKLKNPYLLKRQMQGEIAELFNNSLFSISTDSNSKIIEAPHIFNMIIHVTSSFSINDIQNYNESWNRNSPDSQWFSCSYISNQMICTAPIRPDSVCYGFNDLEKESLLDYGPNDLQSETNDFQQAWGYQYSPNLTPNDIIKKTNPNVDNEGNKRYYNEMVYSRMQGDKKKQPSYIIMFKNNGELINEEVSLKAQKDFGNIPIVLVDIDKTLEYEKQKFIEGISICRELKKENSSLDIDNKILTLRNLILNCKKTCDSWNKEDNFFLSKECNDIFEDFLKDLNIDLAELIKRNEHFDTLSDDAINKKNKVDDISVDNFLDWMSSGLSIDEYNDGKKSDNNQIEIM